MTDHKGARPNCAGSFGSLLLPGEAGETLLSARRLIWNRHPSAEREALPSYEPRRNTARGFTARPP